MIEGDDGDLALEEWLAMTEAQQDAALARAITEYNRRIDALTLAQRIAYARRRAVQNCLDWRKLSFALGGGKFWRGQLRNRQKRLLEIRAWRATGHESGRA